MAKFTIEVEPVADDSELRRQLADALAAVEEWRALAKRHETQTSAWFSEAQAEKHTRETLANDLAKCGEELASACAENERLRGELHKAAEELDKSRQECGSRGLRVAALSGERDRERDNANVLRASNAGLQREMNRAIAERDEAVQAVHQWRDAAMGAQMDCDSARAEIKECESALNEALAERDESRKALADEKARCQNIGIAGCNLKAGSHVVWMDSAELTALRARVAELEAELAAARDNPLSLFDKPTHTTGSYMKQIKPGLWFVGLTVNARGSAGASTEAIKRIAGWI